MLKQVIYNNFKGIKHAVLDLGNTTIIAGKNGLGKTSMLDGISYVLTNTRITENGIGENDLTGFMPMDWQEGDETSVTLVFDSGREYKKVYANDVNRAGKITGHHNECYIDNVYVKSVTRFEDDLKQEFRFTDVLKDFKQIRLETDPLYAFSKMANEPKGKEKLRKLLEALGCNVDINDVYAEGFDDLRKYESKYRGDFVVMRDDINKHVLELRKDVEIKKRMLNAYTCDDEFNDSKLVKMQADMDALKIEYAKLDAGDDTAINELRIEAKKIDAEIEEKITIHNASINAEIVKLQALIKHIEDNAEAIKNGKIDAIKRQMQIPVDDNVKQNSIIFACERDIAMNRSKLQNAVVTGDQKSIDEGIYSRKLAIAYNDTFTGDKITCPCCGEKFFEPTAFNVWKNSHDEAIERYKTLIEESKKAYADADAECKRLSDLITSLKQEKMDAGKKIEANALMISQYSDDIAKVKAESYRDPKIDEYNAQIVSLQAGLDRFDGLDEMNRKSAEIWHKIEDMKNNRESIIGNEKIELSRKINDLKILIDNEYMTKANVENKAVARNGYERAIAELNDLESLYARVRAFINKMVEMSNAKACALTGMDFVLLEENLTDDTINPCCYVRWEGKKYDTLSTSEKVRVGIKFIDVIKTILHRDFNVVRDDLPIIADRIEGFAYDDDIAGLTDEQFICTKVEPKENIEIRVIR